MSAQITKARRQELIDYMRSEVEWYEQKVASGRDDWSDVVECCRDILSILEGAHD